MTRWVKRVTRTTMIAKARLNNDKYVEGEDGEEPSRGIHEYLAEGYAPLDFLSFIES